jgi:hypothetical protein
MDGMLPIIRKLISISIKMNIPIPPNTVIHNILTDFFIFTFEWLFQIIAIYGPYLPGYSVTAAKIIKKIPGILR